MPLLAVEAAKLSNNQLMRGVIEEVIDMDFLYRYLPFTRVEGKAHVYNRENALASAQFITVNVDVPESATTFTEVSVTLRIIAGDVDVDNFLQQVQSDHNDQKATQVAFKAKAVARLFSDKLVNGDASTAYNLSALGGGGSVTNVEFDGMDILTVGGQIVTNGTNGGALSFDKLDELMDKVPLGIDAFVASRRTIRDYKKLMRALSNVSPEMVTVPGTAFTTVGYAGKPILLNDFISNAKTVGSSADCSTVYAARFNEDDGFFGLFNGDSAGWTIQEIGQLEKRDATRTRVKWYVAAGLRSTKSLAKMTGVRSI
jgi:hypothetical protein